MEAKLSFCGGGSGHRRDISSVLLAGNVIVNLPHKQLEKSQ